MTRILYGVSGEGGGHSSRALVVARHLVTSGHDVRIATYDRGLEVLGDEFETLSIGGFTLATRDFRVSVRRTLGKNLERLPSMAAGSWRLLRSAFGRFEPEVVLSDFEPQTAHLARLHRVPLISLDNQHRMRSMRLPLPPEYDGEARKAKRVISMIVPRPWASLVTTFWFGETLDDRTFLFPPILRRVIRELESTTGDHVLVYVTKHYDALLDSLRAHPDQRFVVYGFEEEREEGNLVFRKRSRDGFLEDLRTCRAIVASAGFTLMTEALHLGKPMLAIPMGGQFEQVLNAYLLADMGAGQRLDQPSPEAVGSFLSDLDRFRAVLAGYSMGDEAGLLAKVDELVADGGAALERP